MLLALLYLLIGWNGSKKVFDFIHGADVFDVEFEALRNLLYVLCVEMLCNFGALFMVWEYFKLLNPATTSPSQQYKRSKPYNSDLDEHEESQIIDSISVSIDVQKSGDEINADYATAAMFIYCNIAERISYMPAVANHI